MTPQTLKSDESIVNKQATIQVANAPCSWGVLEFELDEPAEPAGFEQVLDEMTEAGFVGTELGDWGFMPTDPELLRHELLSRRLTMLGAFVPVALINPLALDAGIVQAVKTAQLLSSVSDSAFIVLSDDNASNETRRTQAGRISPHQSLSNEQMQEFAQRANTLAKAVFDATGVKTVFHHHGAGFVETPYEIELFLKHTDPNLIGLCLDTGHYAFGGGDPVEALKKHQDRIWHVHYKDFDANVVTQAKEKGWDYFHMVQHGVFCELGKGSVDFASLTTTLREQNYSGWIVVEQDILPGMGSPFESAKRNRAFLKTLDL